MAAKKDVIENVNIGKEEVKEQKMYRVRLPLTRDKQADVPVIINGKSWLIQRGKEVEVPECVYRVLQNSEEMDALAIERQQGLAQ